MMDDSLKKLLEDFRDIRLTPFKIILSQPLSTHAQEQKLSIAGETFKVLKYCA